MRIRLTTTHEYEVPEADAERLAKAHALWAAGNTRDALKRGLAKIRVEVVSEDQEILAARDTR